MPRISLKKKCRVIFASLFIHPCIHFRVRFHAVSLVALLCSGVQVVVQQPLCTLNEAWLHLYEVRTCLFHCFSSFSGPSIVWSCRSFLYRKPIVKNCPYWSMWRDVWLLNYDDDMTNYSLALMGYSNYENGWTTCNSSWTDTYWNTYEIPRLWNIKRSDWCMS